MVKEQPPFRSLDRNGARTDLDLLPPTVLASRHHAPIPSPVHEVRALAEKDVTERRVPAVAGTAQQQVLATDLPGEQDPVAVEGQGDVLQPDELAEIPGPPEAQGGATGELGAPHHVVVEADLDHARVVGVEGLVELAFLVLPGDLLVFDLPVQAVIAAADV